MKNNSLSRLLMGVFIFTCILTIFSACEQDEKNSTTIELQAFGPSPALRGGELQFIGANLNQVTAVVLPNNIEITEIEVVSPTTIKITIPQETAEGYVVLKTPQGDIETKTRLTFLEPISIESITPLQVKAGQTMTINGDYLNLIAEVIFMDNVVVDSADFVSQSRDKIEVIVPVEAQTGIITLSNGAEIPAVVYSDEIIEVALPTITSVAPFNNVKPGNSVVITGTNLDLVESVIVPDKQTVPFTLNSAKTAITITLPEDVKDGAITLVAFSGVEVVAADDLVVAAPTATTLAPVPVKNGNNLTITGTNLELIKSITFPNVADAVTVFQATSTQIIVEVPEKAQAGNVVLATAAGKTVSIAMTLVTPEVSSLGGSTIAGETLVLNGTNLDLVSKISFDGNKETVEVVSHTATSISLKIPYTVLGAAKINFELKNGVTMQAATLTVGASSLAYVTNLPAECDAGATLTLTGDNFTQLTGITIGGFAAGYSAMNGQTLFVLVPNNANGVSNFVLTTAGGSITYSIKVNGAGPIVTNIWAGTMNAGGWSNFLQLGADKFTDIKVGDKIKVTVDPSSISGSSQGSFKNGSWSEIAPGTDYFTITGDFELTVTSAIKTSLQSGGLIIGGQNYIAMSVDIESPREVETVIWSGSADLSSSWAVSIPIDASSFASLSAGATIKFTFTENAPSTYWQLKIMDGSWNVLAGQTTNEWGSVDLASGATSHSFIVTPAAALALQTSGMVISGYEAVVTSVSIIQ